MKRLLLGALACLTPLVASAAPLTIVTVGAPAINCVFTTASPCSVTVSDMVRNIPLAGGATGRLQSRNAQGLPGSAAAGLFAYEYRVDLTSAVGITAIDCVDWIKLRFGPVTALDYNGDRRPDQVFVVTAGGLGTIGLASAVQTGDVIKFNFSAPVCGGASPGRGATSFFFGVVSPRPPRDTNVALHTTLGAGGVVAGRTP